MSRQGLNRVTRTSHGRAAAPGRGRYSELELARVEYHDLQGLARDLGVRAVGSRAAITRRILRAYGRGPTPSVCRGSISRDGRYTRPELHRMEYSDIQAVAVQLRVPATGPREVITRRILRAYGREPAASASRMPNAPRAYTPAPPCQRPYTYPELNSMPDMALRNLARTLGMEVPWILVESRQQIIQTVLMRFG